MNLTFHCFTFKDDNDDNDDVKDDEEKADEEQHNFKPYSKG